MSKVHPLPIAKLHATCDPDRLPWKDSREIPLGERAKNVFSHFQPRAMQALDLALQIKAPDYHIYVCGDANIGRRHMINAYLKQKTKNYPAPADLVYVNNFTDPHKPRLIVCPAGAGQKVKNYIDEMIAKIGEDLERRLSTLKHVGRRASLVERHQRNRSDLFKKMNQEAEKNGFKLEMDENGGISLTPFDKSEEAQKNRSPSDLAALPRHDSMAKNIMGFMRQFNQIEEEQQDDERELERELMQETLKYVFSSYAQKILKLFQDKNLSIYLDELKIDILKNTQNFIQFDNRQEDVFRDYQVNIFVDNSGLKGAPIIMEDNPLAANLLGSIEREAELGSFITDFTLLRSGSLHRANGGFLIIYANDMLQHEDAWNALLRALHSGEARLEEWGETRDAPVKSRNIEPDPVKLDVKIIIIGDEEIFETLLEYDERFVKLFRAKAHMSDAIQRTPAAIRSYLLDLGAIIKDNNLPWFDASALAWLVDLGSHICEDQRRLSLRFPMFRELMLEASAFAKIDSRDHVDASLLEKAYAHRFWRRNLVEEEFMEEYDRELIGVKTRGKEIGQVNGLSITSFGDFEFGLPHSISCTAGVGHDGIMDLEREADLGGPIHTKAMLILKSFLIDLFARKKPLVLSASLYFEQSYAGIEGDSASGAELAALLSALAEIPVRQDLAFTGAVSHSGQIMAVGGVTAKIEGFYKVCSRRGLTGTQGVIIPAANVDHLMLAPEILNSVEQGQFFIYPVNVIEEALELLTGLKAGRRRKNGTFTTGSLYALVDERLEKLGRYAQTAFGKARKDER